MSTTADTSTITHHEAKQDERANETGRRPVVFVHGLWLLPSSWDRWAALFEEAGFTTQLGISRNLDRQPRFAIRNGLEISGLLAGDHSRTATGTVG